MTPHGEYCDSGYDIEEETVCRAAAASLGMVYGHAWSGAGEHRNCFFADDNRMKVFFNSAVMPSPNANKDFASLCWRVPPQGMVQRCVPGTEETEVTESGAWAIAVFSLAAVWISALWFVLILFAPGIKVHPDPTHGHDDPYGLAAFRQQQENTKMKQFKKKCKNLLKFMFKSIETIIGTGIFVISGIAIVVTGGAQLPMERPDCAKEPRFAPIAWAEEPAERFSIVWCELGAIASVCLSALAFCCFLLAFSMSFVKVRKIAHEDQKRKKKKKLKKLQDKAKEKGQAVDEGPDYGEGFRIQKMIPKEPVPEAIFSDYDGRIFDV